MKQYIIWDSGVNEYLIRLRPLRFKFSDGFIGEDALLFQDKKDAEKALCTVKEKVLKRYIKTLPKRGRANALMILQDEIEIFLSVRSVQVSLDIH
jgi:hypothetical protein